MHDLPIGRLGLRPEIVDKLLASSFENVSQLSPRPSGLNSVETLDLALRLAYFNVAWPWTWDYQLPMRLDIRSEQHLQRAGFTQLTEPFDRTETWLMLRAIANLVASASRVTRRAAFPSARLNGIAIDLTLGTLRLCEQQRLTAMRRPVTKHGTKPVSRMKKSPESKSLGTRIAEKARAKANTYSDQKREQLLDRGMALIYGDSRHVKINRNRG